MLEQNSFLKMNMCKRTFLILFLAWQALACHSTRSRIVTDTTSTQAGSQFQNPITNGADPWITKHEQTYYYCFVGAGNTITVSKSNSITNTGKRVKVWTAPKTGWNSDCIWAPELHRIGNKWYIYYAAGKSGPPYVYQRSGVLESVTDDPQGEYIDRGVLKTGSDPADHVGTIWAIDVTLLKHRNDLYAVWSGWEKNTNTDKTPQHLYIARMSNPYTISSERIKISSPVESWETGGPLNLNEGPQILQRKNNTFIIYSTRESWTQNYRLGQLKLKPKAKTPMSPESWEKSGPVFQGTDKVHGVGHASFTRSPDNKEWWIIYHSKKDLKPGWDRDIRAQKFEWDSNGNPIFGMPQPAGIPLKKPSGETSNKSN